MFFVRTRLGHTKATGWKKPNGYVLSERELDARVTFVCITRNISGKSNLDTRIRLFGANAWAGWIRPSSSSSSSPSPCSVFVPWKKKKIGEKSVRRWNRSVDLTKPPEHGMRKTSAWMEIMLSFTESSLRRWFMETKLNPWNSILNKSSCCFKDGDNICEIKRIFLKHPETSIHLRWEVEGTKQKYDSHHMITAKSPLYSMPGSHECWLTCAKTPDSYDSRFWSNQSRMLAGRTDSAFFSKDRDDNASKST